MNVSCLLRRCRWCGRSYQRSSKPVWCFDEALNVAGTAHTGHARFWREATGVSYWNAVFGGDPEVARRLVWAHDRHPDLPFGPFVLFTEPGERERQLAYWHSTGYVAEDEADALIESVERMEQQYLEQFPDRLELGN